jgi:hypothetical protein
METWKSIYESSWGKICEKKGRKHKPDSIDPGSKNIVL